MIVSFYKIVYMRSMMIVALFIIISVILIVFVIINNGINTQTPKGGLQKFSQVS